LLGFAVKGVVIDPTITLYLPLNAETVIKKTSSLARYGPRRKPKVPDMWFESRFTPTPPRDIGHISSMQHNDLKAITPRPDSAAGRLIAPRVTSWRDLD